MKADNAQSQMLKRKLEHIRIVVEEDVEPVLNPFDNYRLPYLALPEIDMQAIDTGYEFLGYKLKFPFMVASMTGGPAKSGNINENLAKACNEAGVALGLGSMRVALKDAEAAKSFAVKQFCPDVPVIANLGLVQLNYGYGVNEINKLLDLSGADAIFLHVNHLQEAVQPEGDVNFAGLIAKLEKILPEIKKPVIIKEVGTGIDATTAKRLADIGVKWIDVSGMGGTSWTVVEAYRRQDDLGFVFAEEGIPTDEALLQCKEVKGVKLIAEGGVRTGLDIAKSIVLGAELAAAAKPLLSAALESSEACTKVLKRLEREFKVAMFTAGAVKVSDLKKMQLISK